MGLSSNGDSSLIDSASHGGSGLMRSLSSNCDSVNMRHLDSNEGLNWKNDSISNKDLSLNWIFELDAKF